MDEAENAQGRRKGCDASTGNGPLNATPKKVIVIGGGIAGLACGCYLQMNGIQSEILEAGLLPGGLCTAWKRGPYVFDGCMRWLLGTNPTSVFHQLWKDLGVIDGRAILASNEILRFETADGKSISIPANLDEIAREFKRVAPEDSKQIDLLIRDAGRAAPHEPPIEKPVNLMPLLEKLQTGLRYLPLIPVAFRWKNLPIGTYLKRYKNAFLRNTLTAIVGNEALPTLVLVMVLAFRTRNNAGFVAGGSLDFATSIADRYIRLGGTLRYQTRVSSIQVQRGRAVGVKCADGTFIPASTVVSCADGYTTIFKMLGGRFVDKKIRRLYEKGNLFPALIQVSLGIGKVFADAPRTLNLALHQPLEVDDRTRHDRLEIETFGSDSRLCPEGTSLMTVRLPACYDFWAGLKERDPDRYSVEKENVLRRIVAILDKRFPGLAQSIENSDVATPATFVRYTGNWRGSYQGWLPTPRVLERAIPNTLPGLNDFYMAGHWVAVGGGLPIAALSGRFAAHTICAARGKPFLTTEPRID